MTSRFTDPHRASGQLRWRGAIVLLAAVAIVAVIAMAALGIAEQRLSEDRLANQIRANAAAAAETVLDRDRQVLSRLAAEASDGRPDAMALPALPPELRAI